MPIFRQVNEMVQGSFSDPKDHGRAWFEMVHLHYKIQVPTKKKLSHGYSALGIMHMMSSQPRLSMSGATGQNLLGTELRAGQSHALALFTMLV